MDKQRDRERERERERQTDRVTFSLTGKYLAFTEQVRSMGNMAASTPSGSCAGERWSSVSGSETQSRPAKTLTTAKPSMPPSPRLKYRISSYNWKKRASCILSLQVVKEAMLANMEMMKTADAETMKVPTCISNEQTKNSQWTTGKDRKTNEIEQLSSYFARPVAGKSPWGGPSPPNSPKSPLFVRVPPLPPYKKFSPWGGGLGPPSPPLSDGLVLRESMVSTSVF